MSGTPRDPAKVEAVIALTNLGWSQARIAEALHCSTRTVEGIRRAAGVSRPPPTRLADAVIERIVELTNAGWTAEKISDELGVSTRAVSRWRMRRGIGGAAPKPFTASEIRTAEQLLADGASLAEVARTIGRSHDAVIRRFRGRGWTREQTYAHRASLRQAQKAFGGL